MSETLGSVVTSVPITDNNTNKDILIELRVIKRLLEMLILKKEGKI